MSPPRRCVCPERLGRRGRVLFCLSWSCRQRNRPVSPSQMSLRCPHSVLPETSVPLAATGVLTSAQTQNPTLPETTFSSVSWLSPLCGLGLRCLPSLACSVLPRLCKRLLEFASCITKGCFHFLSAHPAPLKGSSLNPSSWAPPCGLGCITSLLGDVVYRWHLMSLNSEGTGERAAGSKGYAETS